MVDYTLNHTYTQGCPTAIAKVYEGDQVAMARVDLTGCAETITATVARAPEDTSGYVARVEWSNGDQGTVQVQWDADAPITAQPQEGFLDKTYTPEQDGQHSVRITDEDDPNRFAVVDFTIPLPEGGGELDLTISPASEDGYTALAIWGPSDTPVPPDTQLTVSPSTEDGYAVNAAWNLEGETP